MSCSDSKKSKKRKSSKSGNMGDVLGKECGDGEKDEMPQEMCSEDVREEADGAPNGDEQSSQSSGELDSYELKRSDDVKVSRFCEVYRLAESRLGLSLQWIYKQKKSCLG